MLEALKREVYQANMLLPQYGLVSFTWGNVSGIDRTCGRMVIKPSGVEYGALRWEDMATVDLMTGEPSADSGRPSSDADTHLFLYRAFPQLGGIVHTHSRWAVTYAQAGRGIPVLGTTHSDYFHGEIPCTRAMTTAEIAGPYEVETGRVIVETFRERSYEAVPAVLVHSHGPFTWGATPLQAVQHAAVLEEVAFLAWHTERLSPDVPPLQQALLDRHYFRKHGDTAYYGQTPRPD